MRTGLKAKSLGFLIAALLLTALVYWPSLRGGFVFDDFPNIVDNPAVHITQASPAQLAGAALGSPSSDFRRPLASLSFALNWLASGADPWPMKLTNLVIHLINGLLVYATLLELLRFGAINGKGVPVDDLAARRLALCVTGGWLLLPINLLSVAYVVQRMESLCQVMVLGGLWFYLHGRRRMLEGHEREGFVLAAAGLVAGIVLGGLSKESAVLLPVYAFLAEYALSGFRKANGARDRRVIGLFVALLLLPAVVGLAWLLPQEFNPGAWSGRPFTLGERLLTEPRVLVDYLQWTLLPDPRTLSLYHDDIATSRGLFTPPATLFAILALLALLGLGVGLLRRRPLVALGILWFFAAHLLTATVVPLELAYEHRNYFASIGVLLPVFSALLGNCRVIQLPIVRGAVVALLLVWFAAVTLLRAQEWSDPLRLAMGEANRHPDSARANYEAGRLLVIMSKYNPSPALDKAQVYLRRASSLADSSILSELALLMVAEHTSGIDEDAIWNDLIAKLRTHPVSEEAVSALDAFRICRSRGNCHFDVAMVRQAFDAALAHPDPSARLLGEFAAFERDLQNNDALAVTYLKEAVALAPAEPAYRIDLAGLLAIHGQTEQALQQIDALRRLDTFGRLDPQIAALEGLAERGAPPKGP